MATRKIYKTAYTRGSLKECLKTEEPITEAAASYLIETIYTLYTYDARIHAVRYILKDLEYNLGLPTWIHIYEVKDVEDGYPN